jgi:predicted transcriptional regulator
MAMASAKTHVTYTLTLSQEERNYLVDLLQNSPNTDETAYEVTQRSTIYAALKNPIQGDSQ